jgi:molecular chaperone DnaK
VFEVKSTHGDTSLGGDDWDQRVIDWLVDSFKGDHGVDLGNDKMALQRLKEAAEKAKIELSTMMETDINLPFITADASGPKHLTMRLTRAKFEQLVGDIIRRTMPPLEQALKDSGLSAKEINEVILVGGSTRIPMVQQLVTEFFGKEPNKSVNPDEVVAVGAAIQAGILGGEVKDVLLLDVTPLSLGIETYGGVMTTLIPRNTTIPSRKSETFSTASDNQTQVEVHVLQGERPMARDNKSIGKFVLDGIPVAPRGMPQIEVTFDIDTNGILHVTARDKATGRDQRITIQASSGLSDEQIKQMVDEAQRNADSDKGRRETAENKNRLEHMAWQMEKTLKDAGDKLTASEKSELEAALAEARSAVAGDDAGRITAAYDRLTQAGHAVAQHLYQSGGATGPGPAGGEAGPAGSGSPPPHDGVVDAEVVDDPGPGNR